MLKRALLPILVGLALSASAVLNPPAFAGERPPTVVELFTSQGCSSCPPADALLGEIAERSDIIGLTFNVDYWDYLGWRDTLASPANTGRQHAYAQTMGRRSVYTPQMVVGGKFDVVGSDRAALTRAIVRDRGRDDATLEISFARKGDMVLVRIAGRAHADDANIVLFRYTDKERIEIARGENAGNHLSYYNVVRDFRSLGLWRGGSMEIALAADDLAKDGVDGFAVMVQMRHNGPIVGAATMHF
jgi:hypothetical protein